MLANYDLAEVGYHLTESFVAGTAALSRPAGPPTADGVWNAAAAQTAPFKTRLVVVVVARPGNRGDQL